MKYLALLLMVLCLAKAFIIESEEDPEQEIEVHFLWNLLIFLGEGFYINVCLT